MSVIPSSRYNELGRVDEANELGGIGFGGRGRFASVAQIAKEVALMSNPIGRIAWRIVTNAIDAQASAIQIKLEGGRMVVYYHSEGGIHQQMNVPGQIFPRVVTRYKLWADVGLLNRRYPLKGQFPLIHGRRHYGVDVIREDPRHDPTVTLSIVAGAQTQMEWAARRSCTTYEEKPHPLVMGLRPAGARGGKGRLAHPLILTGGIPMARRRKRRTEVTEAEARPVLFALTEACKYDIYDTSVMVQMVWSRTGDLTVFLLPGDRAMGFPFSHCRQ